MLLAATISAFSPVYTGSPIQQSRNPNKVPTRSRLLKRTKRTRPNRITKRKCQDPNEHLSFGDSIYKWTPSWLRIFFQNAYGLTYSTGGEDYKYYMKCLKDLNVNVAGICETNRAWQHPHLRAGFSQAVRCEHNNLGKTAFGYPTHEIDPIPSTENTCAGGSVTSVFSEWVTRVHGDDISDPSGLGRWSGITLRGKDKAKLSIITAYRVCAGSIRTAPIGSSFAREHEFFKESGTVHPNPRKAFFDDISVTIKALQKADHKILLMFDANEHLVEGQALDIFVKALNLHDMQGSDPAPSTYIGTDDRRLDYMFGCADVLKATAQQGTLAYSVGPASDHRGLFVDLDIQAILGTNIKNKNMVPSSARLLKSGHPESVLAYNKSMRDYYDDHKMVARIRSLNKQHKSMTKKQVRKHLNRWDRDQGRSMLAAEAALRKPPQPYKWSDKLRNAGLLRRYWKFRHSEALFDLCYSENIDKLEAAVRAHDPSFSFPFKYEVLPIEEIRIHFNAATKALTKCQDNAEGHRIQNQYDLLAQYESDKDPATKEESNRKAVIVRRNIQGEETRGFFNNINNVVKPRASGGVQKLLVPRHKSANAPPDDIHALLRDTPEKDLVWEHIADADAMEKYLLKYNHKSFRAAAESPCGHGIIHDAMSYSSLTPAGEELLQGKIPPEWHGDNDLLREFLASFAIPQNVKEAEAIKTEISVDDFVYGIKHWSEKTSTSPSGRHLGHYKSLIQDPVLLECQVLMMNIAIHHGIALDRWSKSVTVMLEKDAGAPRINRLRIIHLFEADFNLFLKLQWGSRLVKHAVKHDLLNDGQHGSTPGKVSMDPVMLTQLTTDISRLLKVNLARFDNDASACYDRIIVMLGMLAARRCGMPTNVVSTHAEALRLMKYAVKTIHGISEQNYQGTPFECLFGTGQGSGASPSVWLTLVVILMNTIDKLTPECMYFQSPNGKIKHSRRSDAFVDDTSLGFSDYGKMTYNAMVAKLQEIAQRWENLLHYSGGSLNLKKCFWFVMYWQWHHGRPQCRAIKANDPTVSLTSGSNTKMTPIENRPIAEASKMLGVWLSPTGNFAKHLEVMKAKADKFSIRIRSSRLTPTDIRTFHKTMYFPSMRYSLAALAVDEEELHQLQTKIVPTMLQRLGASSTTPTVIRHGPTDLAGLDLVDMRTELGIEMIKCLRHAVYAGNEVGKLMLINLGHSQQEAGIGPLLFEQPDLYIPYLTTTWLTSVRQYMSHHNIKMTFTEKYGIPLQNKRDKYIMDLKQLQSFSEDDQLDINLVRIFLQVNSLVEITECKGIRIRDSAFNGKRDEHQSTTQWPRQMEPTPRQVRLWQKYLTNTFISHSRYLKQPVGIPQPSPAPPPIVVETSCDTLQEALSLLPIFQHRIIEESTQVATDIEIWRAFRSKRRLEIITDGGLKEHNATFGWKIILPDRKILFQGAGPADGPQESESSTRSELFGFAAPMLIIVQLAKWWGLKHRCKFRWLVDSSAAIKQVREICRKTTLPQYQPDNADVVTLIFHLLQECRRPIKIDWVKGHQDDFIPYDELSRDAQLNVDVDHLATGYRESGRSSRSKLKHFDPMQVSVSVNHNRLPGKIEEAIRYHVNGTALKSYIAHRNKWSSFNTFCVDWYSFGLNFRQLRPTEQVQHMKFVHDIQPLGWKRYQISKSKEVILSRCPCCKTAVENPVHFLTCPTQRPSRYRHFRVLRNSMGSSHAHPALDYLYRGIHQWINNPLEPPTLNVNAAPIHLQPILIQALKEQEQIGWHQAMKGFLTTSWASAAAIHPTKPRLVQRDRGQHRISRTITAIRAFTDGIWKDRNDVLHQHADTELKRIRSLADSEIRHYHANPDLLPPCDRHYCEGNINDILKKNPSVRRRWLTRVRRSRAGILERERTQQPSIQKHFGTKLITRIRRPPTEPYLTPLRKQMMLSEHFSSAPDPD